MDCVVSCHTCVTMANRLLGRDVPRLALRYTPSSHNTDKQQAPGNPRKSDTLARSSRERDSAMETTTYTLHILHGGADRKSWDNGVYIGRRRHATPPCGHDGAAPVDVAAALLRHRVAIVDSWLGTMYHATLFILGKGHSFEDTDKG
jgi:hypothetical protein